MATPTPMRKPKNALSADEVREIVAAAGAEDKIIVLPYGMAPAEPIEDDASAPIDLGDFDPKLRGMKVVVNRDLSLGVSRSAASLADDKVGNLEKLAIAQEFLEEALLAWNLTVRNPATGAVEALPQPGEGGVRRLRASLLVPMIEAINKALAPDPNS